MKTTTDITEIQQKITEYHRNTFTETEEEYGNLQYCTLRKLDKQRNPTKYQRKSGKLHGKSQESQKSNKIYHKKFMGTPQKSPTRNCRKSWNIVKKIMKIITEITKSQKFPLLSYKNLWSVSWSWWRVDSHIFGKYTSSNMQLLFWGGNRK